MTEIAKSANSAQFAQGCAGCGCLTFLVVGVLGLLLGFCASNLSPEQKKESARVMSFVQCQDFVKRRLKAPATASFPSLDFSALKGNDDRYTVSSYVDAENSFGAKLRSKFVCTIKLVSPAGDLADPASWELIDLQM
jgi:hypothetical protein